MKRAIKRSYTYTNLYKRDRNRLYANLMFKKIRKALGNEHDRQEEENERRKINEPKYWTKWTDPLVIVTIVLAFATFALYWEATRQSGISKQAADAATAADSLTQIAFERDSSRYSKTIERDSTKNVLASRVDSFKFQRQFDLAKASLNAQIKSVQIAQNEFELANRPFLHINWQTIAIPQFASNKEFTIKFSFKNSGKFPARILGTNNSIDIATDNRYKELRKSIDTLEPSSEDYVKLVIGPDDGEIPAFVPPAILGDSNYSKLSSGWVSIYFSNVIKYEDVMTNKKYLTRMIFKITEVPKFSVVMMDQTDSAL